MCEFRRIFILLFWKFKKFEFFKGGGGLDFIFF